MRCDNQKCNWHFENQCVCENENVVVDGRPNSMNCSYFLDKNFEINFWSTYYDCNMLINAVKEKLKHRRHQQLKKAKHLLEKLNKEI
ncbi:hypothetical protein [Maledivibacter halophilus]|uniref:Uncharacterized protein n=1 Tax=Maledivibacter halophilus TaxID=36842 RepID=A0A1T5LW59_9FIRM|nr:hypothetical protein [Maledivibacter halophilus]SKC68489.1 hypothetical protein SAMN02194393_02153 [Maledivibacter halophilus]SKC71624.1 hypothetical protein SAMN02194393_02499 [Maledivibacter halophilus]SKC80236.1 hypothetical protein SAMN02194393_03464 [Maledivibacter halophilus]